MALSGEDRFLTIGSTKVTKHLSHPLARFQGGRFYMERTLVLLKPDCVQRRLMGRVIARFEDKLLNIVDLKLIQVTPDLARRHYAEHVKKDWYPELEAFITSSPIVAMIIEGPEVIRVVREMVGTTNGLNATPGTIRGDFSSSQQMNLVHASDSPASARREIELFFPGTAP
jgi:nucleoside-diphosphate kinase